MHHVLFLINAISYFSLHAGQALSRCTLASQHQRILQPDFCSRLGKHPFDYIPKARIRLTTSQSLSRSQMRCCSTAGAEHSPQKLEHIHALCQDLGVLTQPTRLGPVLICPIISWHHQSFDKEPDIPGVPRPSPLFISDYRACSWPEGFPGRWA